MILDGRVCHNTLSSESEINATLDLSCPAFEQVVVLEKEIVWAIIGALPYDYSRTRLSNEWSDFSSLSGEFFWNFWKGSPVKPFLKKKFAWMVAFYRFFFFFWKDKEI